MMQYYFRMEILLGYLLAITLPSEKYQVQHAANRRFVGTTEPIRTLPKIWLLLVMPNSDTQSVFESKHWRCSGNEFCDLDPACQSV